jgi:hypothetical protein
LCRLSGSFNIALLKNHSFLLRFLMDFYFSRQFMVGSLLGVRAL